MTEESLKEEVVIPTHHPMSITTAAFYNEDGTEQEDVAVVFDDAEMNELKSRVTQLEDEVLSLKNELRLFKRKFRALEIDSEEQEEVIKKTLLRLLDNQNWKISPAAHTLAYAQTGTRKGILRARTVNSQSLGGIRNKYLNVTPYPSKNTNSDSASEDDGANKKNYVVHKDETASRRGIKTQKPAPASVKAKRVKLEEDAVTYGEDNDSIQELTPSQPGRCIKYKVEAQEWKKYWDFNMNNFKPGWVELIRNIIKENNFPDCNFKSKDRTIDPERTPCITFRGNCKETYSSLISCPIIIRGTIKKLPITDNDVKVEITIKGNSRHNYCTQPGNDRIISDGDVSVVIEEDDFEIDKKPKRNKNSESTKTRPKTVKCSHCDKLFRDCHDMKRHETIHTNEKPYACPECVPEVRFRQKHHRERHMLRFHPPNIEINSNF